jgi:hypothetical protein
LYTLSGCRVSARTAYAANVDGSNCIGPCAPAKFDDECTPGAFDWP